MDTMSPARWLMVIGATVLLIGLVWMLAEKLGLGRLPGDIKIEGERFTFYFPLVTCIVISALLTAIFWIVQWWRHG